MSSKNPNNHFLQAAVLALSLSGLVYALALALGWQKAAEINGVEVFAGALNYAAAYLCIKQRRTYALVGILGTAAWSYVFFSNDLLASGVVNLYLSSILIYSWWRWGEDEKTRPVHHLALRWFPVYAITTGLVYLGAVWITHALGGKFVFWDAAVLVLTILAQLLQDQKVIQAWLVWTVVNIVGVILYWQSGLFFAVAQQLLFGFANIWGWRDWYATMASGDDEDVN